MRCFGELLSHPHTQQVQGHPWSQTCPSHTPHAGPLIQEEPTSCHPQGPELPTRAQQQPRGGSSEVGQDAEAVGTNTRTAGTGGCERLPAARGDWEPPWGTAGTLKQQRADGEEGLAGGSAPNSPRVAGRARGSGGILCPEDGAVCGKHEGFSVQAQQGHGQPKPLLLPVPFSFSFCSKNSNVSSNCGLNHSPNITFFKSKQLLNSTSI